MYGQESPLTIPHIVRSSLNMAEKRLQRGEIWQSVTGELGTSEIQWLAQQLTTYPGQSRDGQRFQMRYSGLHNS